MRLWTALVLISLAVVACSNSGGPKPQLLPNRTFCAPQSEPNVYLRIDLSQPIAQVRLVRMTEPGAAPIVYNTPNPIDGPWVEMASADELEKEAKDDRFYVLFAGRLLTQEENQKAVTDFGKFRTWLGTGISHPKPVAQEIAGISTGRSNRILEIPTGGIASCEVYDSGLLKPTASPSDFREYILYQEGNFAAKTPEGKALYEAVVPQLPVQQISLHINDLTSKSWCLYLWNTGPNIGVSVYTFSATELMEAFFKPGDPPRGDGTRSNIRMVGNQAVKTKLTIEKDWNANPQFWHNRDASGREYLQEHDGLSDISAFRRLSPCNDERVFAIHPEWRDLFQKVRSMQLETLKSPEDRGIGFVYPYVDQNGIPQLKVIPNKDK